MAKAERPEGKMNQEKAYYEGIEKVLRDFLSHGTRFFTPEGGWANDYHLTDVEIDRLLEKLDAVREIGEESDNEGTLQVVTHRLPGSVIKELDRITAERGYQSRSKLIRDLVTGGLEESDNEGTLQVVTHRLPGSVIKELDRITAERGYHSRSKLIRDLVAAGLEEPIEGES